MKRAFLLVVAVLTAFSVPCQGLITGTITLTGSYAVAPGTTRTIVDVYRIALDAGTGRTVAWIALDIGTAAGFGGYDPFQAAWVQGGKHPWICLTPTWEDASWYLDVPDGTNCYQADTHFLPHEMDRWTQVAVAPTETNDGSIYSPGIEDYRAGVGSLRVSAGIPEPLRTQTVDLVQIGVIRGQWVGVDGTVTDDLGDLTEIVYMPEPGMLSLLALGGLALIRRRAR